MKLPRYLLINADQGKAFAQILAGTAPQRNVVYLTRRSTPALTALFCQWCSDERCALCLRDESDCRAKKLSMAEQIALYEEVNRKDAADRKQ